MRKLLAIAALIATGGTAVGAGAINLLGSDAMKPLILDVLAECTGASAISYLGTGAGNGELALVGTVIGSPAPFNTGQTVAPMPRFLASNACGAGAAALKTSTGLVVGLDGLHVLTSTNTANACNGTEPGNCTPVVGGAVYSGGGGGTTSVSLRALSGTFSVSNGSTAVTSSASQVGVLAAGDTVSFADTPTVNYKLSAAATGTGFTLTTAYAGSTNATDTATQTYVFTTWKDVISVLTFGWSHESSTEIKGNGGIASGCGSPLRGIIANNWGSFFQTACTSPDGCTQLQHIFRRDDSTGQAEFPVTLLSIKPSPSAASNFGFGTTPYCNANALNITATTDGSGASPIQITTSTAHHLTTGQGVQIIGVGLDVSSNPSVANGNLAANGVWAVTVVDALDFTLQGSAGTGTAGFTAVGSYALAVLPPPPGLGASGTTATTPGGTVTGLADYIPTSDRDFDPVRRPCANAGSANAPLEDVCSRDNQLGLVLPITTTDFLNNGTTAGQEAQYPGSTNNYANVCTGTNLAVQAAKYTDPTQSAVGSLVTQLAQCPNGDTPHNGNQCTTPVNSGAAATACLNSASNKPSIIFNSHNTLASPSPLQTLGLVYNTRLLTPAKAFQLDKFSNPIVGAYYRIHEQDVIAGYGGGGTAGGNGSTPGLPCVNADPQAQSGCLVQASPCSISYDGGQAQVWNGTLALSNTGALEINEQFADSQCIAGSVSPAINPFTYPLSRKLYLNTIVGWAASTAPEQALAACLTGTPALSGATGTLANTITDVNYINFVVPSPGGGQQPFAEDFNEPLICPTQVPPASNVNTNTFATAPTVAGSVIPAAGNGAGTTCGNGIKETYEDCDDGTPNATTGAGWPSAAVPNNAAAFGNGGASSNCSTTCRWTNSGFTGDPNGTVTGGTCSSPLAPNGTNCTTVSSSTGAPAGSLGKCQNGACLPN